MGKHKNVHPVSGTDSFKLSVATTVDAIEAVAALFVDGQTTSNYTLDVVAHKNDALYNEAKLTWYGLSDDEVAAFKDAFGKAGVVDGDTDLKDFRGIVTEWKKLTQALAHLNDAGHAIADALGQ